MNRHGRVATLVVILTLLTLLGGSVFAAAPVGGKEPVFTVAKVDAGFVNKTASTATAVISINVSDLGYGNFVAGTETEAEPLVSPYVSQVAYALISPFTGIGDAIVITNVSFEAYAANAVISGAGVTNLSIADIAYRTEPYTVYVVIASVYQDLTYYTEVNSEKTFSFDPAAQGVPVAAAVAGAELDIYAERLYFSALSGDSKLYYRYTAAGKKAGAWTDSKIAVGATYFSLAKLINKKGTLEFAVATSVPSKDTQASTLYKFADRATISDKPKIEGYYTINDNFFAQISKFNPETMTFKRGSDTAFYATAEEGCTKLGAKLAVEGNVYGVPVGFYYPVGPTATQLDVVFIPSYNVTEETYTAASKSLKLSVAAISKPPSLKVNYAKNVLPTKDAAIEILVDDTWQLISSAVSNAVYAWNKELKGLELTAALYDELVFFRDGLGNEYYAAIVRQTVTSGGKKPGSEAILLPILPKAKLADDSAAYMTIQDNKLVAVSGSYILEHLSNGKWKKGLPKYTPGTAITSTPFRIAAGGGTAASDVGYLEVSAEGVIKMSLEKLAEGIYDLGFATSSVEGFGMTATANIAKTQYREGDMVKINVVLEGTATASGLRTIVVTTEGSAVSTLASSTVYINAGEVNTTLLLTFIMPAGNINNLKVSIG